MIQTNIYSPYVSITNYNHKKQKSRKTPLGGEIGNLKKITIVYSIKIKS